MIKRGSLNIVLFIFICGILAGIIFTAVFRKQPTGPEVKQPELLSEFFPVYGYDDQLNNQQINYYVRIPGDLSLNDKLKRLAAETSKLAFGGRKLEVKEIALKDGKKIAVINIQEDENFDPKKFDRQLYRNSWLGGTFQGSTGGLVTEFTLLETFLQPDYKDIWIDGIEFLYNGQEIIEEQWDHVNLSESPYFDNPCKQKNNPQKR